MKSKLITTTLLLTCLGISDSNAQGFDPGSNGSFGPLTVTVNTKLDLPTNGIFQCTTITVAAGVTLGFKRNPLNTPVHLLATGDVNIDGIIDVSGENGGGLVGGQGGPGGFDGGMAGFANPPGAGYGPGAGRGGILSFTAAAAGSASHGSIKPNLVSTNKGAVIYGSPLLLPLVGGSGSGGMAGSPGLGGAGGGGAILIASKTRINIKSPNSSRITALGGVVAASGAIGGSGGGIRLVAPIISGDGALDVRGGGEGGDGRIRIDTLERRDFRITCNPIHTTSMGTMMLVFPFVVPRLDILEAAGTVIAEGTPGPVQVQLPFGSPTNRTVKVQARNFNKLILVNVVLTPDSGDPIVYDVQIDNSASNPALATVNVGLPVNQRVTVNAWKR